MEQHLAQASTAKEFYEAAYLFEDLRIFRPKVEQLNCLLMMAICFQKGAQKENTRANAMAAEAVAFELYQRTIKTAFSSNAFATVYVLTHAVKGLSQFNYEPLVIPNVDQLINVINKPVAENSMVGTLSETMEEAAKRLFYFIDLAPVYTLLKSWKDWKNIHTVFSGLLLSSLKSHLEQRPKPDFKLAYHLYDELITPLDKEALNSETYLIKMQAINASLEEIKTNINKIAKFIDPPYIPMRKTEAGWFDPNDRNLHFPEAAKTPVYTSFDGFAIETGAIEWFLKEWKPGDPLSAKLFTLNEFLEMLRKGISWGIVSIDRDDPYKKFNPLQFLRYDPPNIAESKFLRQLFLVDYLHKMIAWGYEISSRPPYLTRPIDILLADMPKDLRQKITIVNDENENRTHHYWIEAGKIQIDQKMEGNKKIVRFGKITMKVEDHALETNIKGDFQETRFSNKLSREAIFAKNFTENWQRIAEYFPLFKRAEEFLKIAGAIDLLKKIRQENNAELQILSPIVPTLVAELERQKKEKKTLLEKFALDIPNEIKTAPNPNVNVQWWNEKYSKEKQSVATSLSNDLKNLPNKNTPGGSQNLKELLSTFSFLKEQMGANYQGAIEALFEKKFDPLASAIAQRRINQEKNNWNDCKKSFSDTFSVLEKSIPTLFSSLLDQFLARRAEPLAYALAEDQIKIKPLQDKLMKTQKIEEKFKSIEFEAEAKTQTKPTYRIPSLFSLQTQGKTQGYVIGGFKGIPDFSPFQSVSSLEYKIRNAEGMLQEARREFGHYSGRSARNLDYEIRDAEIRITQAKNTLFWKRQEEYQRGLSIPHLSYHHQLNSEAINYSAKPVFGQTNPLVQFRLQENYQKQLAEQAAMRSSIDPTALDTVLKYTTAVFKGAVEGVGDLVNVLTNPLPALKETASLVKDAIIIASVHSHSSFTRNLDPESAQAYNKTCEEIKNNSALYTEAVTNMQTRLRQIKEGIEIFKEAKGSEKVQMSTRLLTNIFTPGILAKTAKVIKAGLGTTQLASEPFLLSAANLASDEVIFPPGTLSGAKAWSTKARLKVVGLPHEGKVRYVPPEWYEPKMPLPKGKNGGYLDRHNNEWFKGASRTLDESCEWDVRLSPVGQQHFREFMHSHSKGSYLNVSQKGRITH